ncbi:helix-turn-helix domain-containing protein [Haladaptatus sp. DYSN1]|uniref:helix-turn-helix domain-containing protein n=1 Tax=unclassified Haladaptatus TaxID=2622732 RepID=UPI0024073627|nr:helix-turn-helix domain-containing protein [Haladaptatus sp. DYSN1]
MYKAVFRIHGSGPYARATERNDTEIELWCNDHCDLLHVTGEHTESVLANVEEEVGIREHINNDTDQVVITDACLKEHGSDYVETYLAKHDCLLLPPLRYEKGAKIVRVLALDPANLTNFYRDITADHRVTVESKQELATVTSDTPLMSMESVLPTLSARQREVFLAAHAAGYYEIPRRTTTTELAKTVGVGRRTVEHHLRRAEQKFADALVEYL